MDAFKDYLLDALIDSAKMLPFLFAIYLLIEFLEHRLGSRFPSLLGKTAKAGPLAGGFVGAIPQCGLAAASASLYCGNVITLGTLIAVFLSSSDEMLPIMISSAVPVLRILKILGVKIAIAIASGYLVDLAVRSFRTTDEDARRQAEQAFAGFEHHGNLFVCALRRTLEIFIYVFVFSLILNIIMGTVGEERIASILGSVPVIGELAAGLVGLIPNCASSVMITELYLDGIIGSGPLFAGLLVNAGVGTMVLIRSGKSMKKSFAAIGLLYVLGVVWGILISLSGLAF